MGKTKRFGVRALLVVALGGAIALAVSLAGAQRREADRPAAAPTGLTVDAHIALSSLVSLGDAHLTKMADVLTLVADSEAARSADWERIRGPLADAARVNVPAALWFARPDGTYWTVEEGRQPASLEDRPYFPRLMGGRTVIGELVVSRSTHRNSAVVAVPVRDRDGSVVGALGSSIRLDRLSAIVREEMGGLGEGLLFFAIDAEPLGALHSDPDLIFTEPMRLGDEGMRRAFREMLAHREGAVTYTFRGSRRTVLYRRSAVSGWWYGFGVIQRS